ncbi:MAG: 2Fe-2S iron-sulfur cluster-binding protein [Acidobacteriota bacterium]
MPKVTFTNFGSEGERTVEFEPGQIPDNGHGKPDSLLQIAMNAGISMEHACGGSCACTTCHVIVTAHDGNLSEADEDELDRLDTAADLTLPLAPGLPGSGKGRRKRPFARVESQLRQ